MDAVSYILSRKYTEDTAIGLGAVKGKPCNIQSITPTDDGNRVTFRWTGDDGTVQTSAMLVKNGIDGESIVSIEIDANNRLKCTLTDGAVIVTNPLDLSAEKIDYTNAEVSGVSNVQQALDKLFEGGGVLKEEIVSTVAIGSVTVGKRYPVGTSLEDIIRDILVQYKTPAVAITLTPDTALYDVVSETLPTTKITANVIKQTSEIAKVDFYVGNTLVNSITTDVADGGVFNYNYTPPENVNKNTTFKVVVTDVENGVGNTSKTVKFVAHTYFGTIGEADVLDEVAVKAMDKVLKDSKAYLWSGITVDFGKVVYCYPSSFGALSSIKDMVNNINYTNSFERTTMTIDNIEYYVYTQIDASNADNVELTFA